LDEAPGGSWSAVGFLGAGGEENPLGHTRTPSIRSFRSRYGINNRLPDGSAPDWRLTAMV
jgi:hypothetical protein